MIKKAAAIIAALTLAVFMTAGFVYAEEMYDEPGAAYAEDYDVAAQDPVADPVDAPVAVNGPAMVPTPVQQRPDFPIRMEMSAELRTGIFWDSRGWTDLTSRVRIHHSYDAGVNRGLLRLDMRFLYNNLGVRTLFSQDMMPGAAPVVWEYAYAFGRFLDDQMMVTIGRMGESPWEWGGSVPRWKWVPHTNELSLGDHRSRLDDQFGIRLEATPAATPGLSFGLTLNQWDRGGPPWIPGVAAADVTIFDLLQETVFGVAFTNDMFHGRLSMRLDSEVDGAVCRFVNRRIDEGMSFMYRFEPRIVGGLVPGLSVSLHGWFTGLGAGSVDIRPVIDPVVDERNTMLHLRNWLYVNFEQPAFTAMFRLGAHITGLDSHVLTVSPGFFYNLPFNLQVGGTLIYEHNIGALAGQANLWPGRTPHFDAFNPAIHFIAVEPQIRLNLGRSYLAFVYGFEQRLDDMGDSDLTSTQRQWWNLRFVIAF